MTQNLPSLALGDLPRADWVTAATIYIPGRGRLGPEWPLAYRLGFGLPLDPDQRTALLHYLHEKPSVRLARLHDMSRPRDTPNIAFTVSVKMIDPHGAQEVVEVVLADPLRHRQAIHEIKEVARPVCPYTALLVLHAHKLAGNSGRVWVVVRDELVDAERARLLGRLLQMDGVVSATQRGSSTFELRINYRLAKEPKRLTDPLAALGIFPDFSVRAEADTYEGAVSAKSGM